MQRAVIGAGIGIVLWLSQACVFAPTNQVDGSTCSDDKECASSRCREGYCAGSSCAKNKSSCAAGWKCIHNEPDAISDFFGSDGSDTCQPTCGSCPGNYFCPKDSKPGETLCTYGKPPLEIVVTPTTAIAGQPTKLTASATSGAKLTTCSWDVQDGQDAESSTATEITRTFKQAKTTTITARCQGEDNTSGVGDTKIEVVCQPSGSACSLTYCCADTNTVCLPSAAGNLCRVPTDPKATVTGPTLVPTNEDAVYTVSVGAGDGVLESASWNVPYGGAQGTTAKYSFSKAGPQVVRATVRLTTQRQIEGTLEVNVCGKSFADCGGNVTCCAPLTCKPSGSTSTMRCQN